MAKFRGIGALLGAISGICYTFSATFSKILNGALHPIMIGWACCLMMFFITGLAVAIKRIKFWTYPRTNQLELFLMGLANAAFHVVQYYAFQMTSLADAITLSATSPLFLVFIQCIFKGEPCRFMDGFVVVSSLVGVVLCAQPPFLFETQKIVSTHDMIGYSVSLSLALIWALFFLLMERIRHIHPVAVSFMSNVYAIVFISILLCGFQAFEFPKDAKVALNLNLQILSNLLAAAFSYISVLYDSPLMASIGRTSDISASILVNYIVFKVKPNVMSIFGSFLIMLGIILPSAISLYKGNVEKYVQIQSADLDEEEGR